MPKQDQLEYTEVDNSVASAKIAFQGAHIFDYRIKGKGSVLFLSEASTFKESKAIRGGVPVCWPWFGPHEEDNSLPNHGFARTSLWKHTATQEQSDTETKVTLTLVSSPETLKLWPFHFRLTLDIYVGKRLRLELTSDNKDTKPMKITSALHTYLKVDNIYQTIVGGFEGASFFDKTKNTFDTQKGEIDFTQEVDRIYQNVQNDVVVKSTHVKHTVRTEGSQTIVVWNPAEALASKMADLANHTQMLCVESANVLDDKVTLEAGESHTLTHIITSEF